MADGDGNVYLHDVRIEQGVQIASEGIVKLSSKGKYISTVASVEAEKGSVRRNIVGMVPTEHGVIYMQKEKEGILVSNTEQEARKFFLLLMRRTGFCVVLMTETVIACFM